MTIINPFEIIGVATSMLGAHLLSDCGKYARLGWPIYLVANCSLIVYAVQINSWGLIILNLYFMYTSAKGVYRSRLLHDWLTNKI